MNLTKSIKTNKIMKEIVLKKDETRKDYLIRVTIAMLNESGYLIPAIKYDEAECDAFCLAEDLKNEFDVKVENLL